MEYSDAMLVFPFEMARNGDGKTSVNAGTSSAAQPASPPALEPPSLEQPAATASEEDQTMSAIAERSDPIFDRWLETELQTEFGSVAAEPIPENLLKLIELHRGRRG